MFKVGDRVRVTDTRGSDYFYSVGAEGVVVNVQNTHGQDVLDVEFDKGVFKTSDGGNTEWLIDSDSVELVE